MERQQNYRHNRAMRRYLPGFVEKWGFLTMLVALVLAVDWLWLERFPELYSSAFFRAFTSRRRTLRSSYRRHLAAV